MTWEKGGGKKRLMLAYRFEIQQSTPYIATNDAIVSDFAQKYS
jgi:hypothetical protein